MLDSNQAVVQRKPRLWFQGRVDYLGPSPHVSWKGSRKDPFAAPRSLPWVFFITPQRDERVRRDKRMRRFLGDRWDEVNTWQTEALGIASVCVAVQQTGWEKRALLFLNLRKRASSFFFMSQINWKTLYRKARTSAALCANKVVRSYHSDQWFSWCR